jgi:hypothetical protein
MAASLPRELNLTGEIELSLPSARTITLRRCLPAYPAWTGPPPAGAPAGKPLLESGGGAAVPELAVLGSFRAGGWDGVWVDHERALYRSALAPAPPVPDLPAPAAALWQRIHREARGEKGAWDLCCWREGEVVFSLVRRLQRDRFTAAQLYWVESAFLAGLTHDQFLVVEWDLS